MIFAFAILFVTLLRNNLKKILRGVYKPLIILFYSGCAFFSISFIIFCIIVLGYTSNEIPDNPDNIDLVIVLGCQTFGYTPSNSLKSRLNTAVDVLNKYSNANCIVSGGQGPDETIPEAESMRNYLEKRGIDANRIYKEERSSSTYLNLIYSKELIDEYNIDYNHVIIVTNEYHILRSAMIAKRVGFNVYTVKAPTPAFVFGSSIMREFFAFFKSLVFDIVK